MNLKERKMVYRVFAALDAVPGANLGPSTQSASVTGVVGFALDMQEVRTHCQAALMALFDGSLHTNERDAQFNAAIGQAETFIEQRKAAGWPTRRA